MFDLYTGILKMADSFHDDGSDVFIEYLLDADYRCLCETYNLLEIAGKNSDFEKSVNLLNWVSSNIYHDGNYTNHIENTAMKLLEYSFGKSIENGINCRSLSLLLTECLLAVGIEARTIYILPLSPFDFDNHVVCEAWIDDLNKWIMLDPSYNLYAAKDGKCLNVIELREALANQEEIVFNEGANYNGDPINKNELLEYYAKDLYRFMVADKQGSNSESIEGRKMINIAPVGYDVLKCTLSNIDYRMKKWGDSENLRAWRKDAEAEKIIYKGLNFLY